MTDLEAGLIALAIVVAVLFFVLLSDLPRIRRSVPYTYQREIDLTGVKPRDVRIRRRLSR